MLSRSRWKERLNSCEQSIKFFGGELRKIKRYVNKPRTVKIEGQIQELCLRFNLEMAIRDDLLSEGCALGLLHAS